MNFKQLIPVTFFSIVACGPKKKEDAKDFLIPTIDFTLPTASDSALTTQSGPMADWNDRFNLEINYLKKDLSVITEVVKGLKKKPEEDTFKFSGKGPAANVSGEVLEIPDGAFQNQATICVNSKVFMVVRWNDDGTKFESTRDMNNTPNPVNATDRKIKLTYTKFLGAQMDLQFYGKPMSAPMATDGPYLTGFASARKLSTGDFTVTAVDDWSSTKDTKWTSADSYLVGKSDASGKGKYVGYAKRLRSAINPGVCAASFSETNPVFCIGRDVPSGTRYSDAQLSANYSDLKSSGVNLSSVAKLAVVDVAGTCP